MRFLGMGLLGAALLFGMMAWSVADAGPRDPSIFVRGAMWGAGLVLIFTRRDWFAR